MIDRGPWPKHSGRLWLLVVLTLVLVALALPVLLGRLPAATEPAGLPTPIWSRPTALAIGRPVATPLPAGPRSMQDHLTLARPISSQGNDSPSLFYPFASRGDGTMPVHHGVEFENPIGTPALAVGEGIVVVAGNDERQVYGARTGFYGQVVILQLAQKLDGSALYIVYGHLSEIYVREGQWVREGDALGAVGMTGSALGPHLHLEVRYGLNDYSAAVNPELWLRLSEGCGALAGSLLTATDEPVADVTITLFRAGAPSRPIRYLSTYPRQGVSSDPAWGENFAAGDLAAGEWIVMAYQNGRSVQSVVTIRPGATTFLTLRF